MKKNLLPLIFLFSFSSICFTQNRYVDSTAAEGGNGSSWETAYNDLQLALNDPIIPDTIFVAQGTYTPDSINGSPDATFLISNDVVLLGGYQSGGEIRDPVLYPTRLSGDLNGDDVSDDFENHKSDNVRTVVDINANISNTTVLDGFIIKGGYADGSSIYANIANSGAGMYVQGSPHLKQCVFKQNYAAEVGGAIRYVTNSNHAITMENCKFERNQGGWGGAVHLIENLGISVQIVNCIFSENTASKGNGGALLLWPKDNGSSFTISSCEFIGNSAKNNAGGLYYFNDESDNLSNVTVLIDSCHFSQNSCTEFNGSGLSAGLKGENMSVTVTNSMFDNNSSAHFGTAFLYGLEGTGQISMDNCMFMNNQAEHDGGLAIGTFGNPSFFEFAITNCQFLENEATDFCGGLEIYAAYPSSYLVEKCSFIGNEANVVGGAMLVYAESEEVEAVIKDCVIQNNNSPNGTAIGAHPIPGEAGTGSTDASFTFLNCLLSDNLGGEETIIVKETGSLNFMNCTIVNNHSDGISMDTPSKVALQNTILFNPGYFEYRAIANTSDVNIISHGGNLIGDLSLDGLLLASDQQNLDPLFVGVDDYHLTDSSPCVDAGNAEGITAVFDLDGNDRIRGTNVDIGAYESPYISVGVREVYVGEVTVFPNPTDSYLNVQLPNTSILSFDIEVFNAMGSLLESHNLNANEEIDVKHLPSGIYFIKALEGTKTYTGQFIKK